MAKFGIALGSGPRGLGFESRHSDQKSGILFYGFRIFLYVGIRKIKCDADEHRRRQLDGGDPLSAHRAQMQTNSDTPTKKAESTFVGSAFFIVAFDENPQHTITKSDASHIIGIRMLSLSLRERKFSDWRTLWITMSHLH